MLSRVIEFNEGYAQFEGIIEIDLLKNEMRCSLAVVPNSKEIYAVTLVRAPEESAGHAQPVMINLLPPQLADVSGEFYLVARFREALNADERALRVFAEGSDASGSVLPMPKYFALGGRRGRHRGGPLFSVINKGPNFGFE